MYYSYYSRVSISNKDKEAGATDKITIDEITIDKITIIRVNTCILYSYWSLRVHVLPSQLVFLGR